jgi:Fur family ferric uptake transcriptional regulator
MSDEFLWLEPIHARGYRITPQRMIILRILREAETHLHPTEIYRRARAILPGMTEATVYRTLAFLTEQGLALAAHIGNGQLVYEIAGHAHHHLICRSCGGILEIEHDLLTELYALFQVRTGYQIDSMHTTFFGLCPECQGDNV